MFFCVFHKLDNLAPVVITGTKAQSYINIRGDWKCEKGKRGTVKNTEVENARLENAAPVRGGGGGGGGGAENAGPNAMERRKMQ